MLQSEIGTLNIIAKLKMKSKRHKCGMEGGKNGCIGRIICFYAYKWTKKDEFFRFVSKLKM